MQSSHGSDGPMVDFRKGVAMDFSMARSGRTSIKQANLQYNL